MNNNIGHTGRSIQLAQMAVGFLLGTGGGGTALALMTNEGSRIVGIITFMVCVLIGGIIVYIFYRDDKERDRRTENLHMLSSFYDECFKNTGQNLALRLQLHAKKSKSEVKPNLKSDIIKMLVEDIETQNDSISKRPIASQTLKTIFNESINDIVNEWKKLADKELETEAGLPNKDAIPLEG